MGESPTYGNTIAPEGKIFMCMACGKKSRDRYGYQKISPGWDESCMLNCILVDDPPTPKLYEK